MSSGRSLARAGRTLSAAATSGAAVVVPLLYVPALASPFALPKQVAFEVAAALGFGGFLLTLAGGGRPDSDAPEDGAAVAAGGAGGTRAGELAKPLVRAATAVLATVALSAVVAVAGTPTGAPYALSAWVRWAALFGLAAGTAGIGRDAPGRHALLVAVSLSAAIVSLIGLAQHLDVSPLRIPVISTPGSSFGNRNLGGEAIALSLPFGLGAFMSSRLWRARGALAVALGLQLLYLAATRARGAWLGGALGLLTVLWLNRQAVSRAMVLAGIGIGALALLVALLPGRSSARDADDRKRLAGGIEVVERSFDPGATALRTRLGLWRRSVAIFRGSPVTGIGAGNWPVIFPRYAEPGAADEGVLRATLAPRQAHDDLLQCLTETGLVGLAALLALGAAVVAAIRRHLAGQPDPGWRATTAGAAGALVALAATGITGFPLEMPATLALSAFALGLVALESPRNRRHPHARARIPTGVAVVLVLALALGSVISGERRLRASAWLGQAQTALGSDPGATGATRALEALARAERASPGFRVSLCAASAASRLRRFDEAAAFAEQALRHEPYSPNAWAVLAAAHLDTDPASARADAERSLALLNDNPLALFVKARAAGASGDRTAAELAWSRLSALGGPAAPEPETRAWAQELLRARDAH